MDPGYWKPDLPAMEVEPFVISTDKGIEVRKVNNSTESNMRELNQNLLQTFSALRRTVSRGDFDWLEKQTGFSPDLAKRLHKSRVEIFQAYSTRLKDSVWSIWEHKRQEMHRANDWSDYSDTLNSYLMLHQAFLQLKLAGHAYRFRLDYAASLAEQALNNILAFVETSAVAIPEEQRS